MWLSISTARKLDLEPEPERTLRIVLLSRRFGVDLHINDKEA